MNKIKIFLTKYEVKLVLTVGFILIALISFQFGYIEGKKNQKKAIVIEKTVEVAKNEVPAIPTVSGVNSFEVSQNSTGEKKIISNCAFVGSKNSNKVHLPTCHFAKLIKPENLVCFSSLEEALKQGRVADKSCIK